MKGFGLAVYGEEAEFHEKAEGGGKGDGDCGPGGGAAELLHEGFDEEDEGVEEEHEEEAVPDEDAGVGGVRGEDRLAVEGVKEEAAEGEGGEIEDELEEGGEEFEHGTSGLVLGFEDGEAVFEFVLLPGFLAGFEEREAGGVGVLGEGFGGGAGGGRFAEVVLGGP